MITSFFKPKPDNSKKVNDRQSKNDKNVDSPSTNTDDEATSSCSIPLPNSKRTKLDNIDSSSSLSRNCHIAGVEKQQMKEISDLSKPVQDLLRNLTEKSWADALLPFVSKAHFHELASFVENERKTKTIYPLPCDVFSALNLTPIDKVKVVIVGQDPYHQPNQGHGLAFSVRKGVQIPPSLRNIYKELNQDPNINTFNRIPTHGYLEKWSKQGVLMLNTVLTVRRNEPNSHSKKGWESFTDEIIKILMMRCYESNVEEQDNRGIVFLLWGKPASLKAEAIIKKYDNCFMQHRAKKKNVSRHTTICTSHPSPLGATKTDSPFLGSRCFSRANTALVNMNMNEIDWYVDD